MVRRSWMNRRSTVKSSLYIHPASACFQWGLIFFSDSKSAPFLTVEAGGAAAALRNAARGEKGEELFFCGY